MEHGAEDGAYGAENEAEHGAEQKRGWSRYFDVEAEPERSN